MINKQLKNDRVFNIIFDKETTIILKLKGYIIAFQYK